MTDKPMTAAGHVHKYGYMPVWKDDGSVVESWWWCSSHDPGAWAKIEDDPEYASLFASDAFTEALAAATHRYRLRFPDGDIFCGSREGQAFEFDSAACSCSMDAAAIAAAMRGEQE